MLDIDLDFLEFLINPSYKYLENDIRLIQNAYLEMADDKDKKKRYFEGVNYLFLQTPEDLYYFIADFYYEIIYDVYSRLFKLFSFVMDSERIDSINNFIDSIFIDNGLDRYTCDLDLNILRTDIRKYLVDVTQNSGNKRDAEFAEKAISEIDKMIEKFDKIKHILEPRLDEVNDILDKKDKIRDSYRKYFIFEYEYLLSDKGKKIIRENKDYDVDSFLDGEELFCKYFIRNCEEVFLVNDLVDIDNLDKRREDADHYNEMYLDSVKEYKYMDETSSLVSKVTCLTGDCFSKNFPYSDERIDDNTMYDLCESVLSDGYMNACYMCFGIGYNGEKIPVKFMKFFNLRTVGFIEHKLVTSFYSSLAHEIGHNFDFGNSGYYLAQSYNEELYEMYTEYRAVKLIDRLISDGKLHKSSVIHNSKTTNFYYDKLFLLIDLFEDYKIYFDEYLLESSERPLRELLGDNVFERLLKYVSGLKTPSDELMCSSICFREEMDREIKKRLKVK